jgi:hypothetical protein
LYIIDLNILLGSLSYYTQSLYFIRYSPCWKMFHIYCIIF